MIYLVTLEPPTRWDSPDEQRLLVDAPDRTTASERAELEWANTGFLDDRPGVFIGGLPAFIVVEELGPDVITEGCEVLTP